MKPLLSILVPTFNRRKELERLLTVLIPQIRANRETCLIISNNASPDDTADFLKDWEQEERVRIIHQQSNLGPHIHLAWLYGQATGDYLWLIGDDDLLESDTIALIIEKLKSKPELGFIHLPGIHQLRDGLPPIYTPCPTIDEYVSKSRCLFAPYISYLGWITSNVIRTTPLQKKLPTVRFSTDWWPQDLLAASIADSPGLVLSARKLNGGADNNWKNDASEILVSQFVTLILDSRWLTPTEKKACLAQRYRDYPSLYRNLLLQNPRLFLRVTWFKPSLIFRTKLISKGIKRVCTGIYPGFPSTKCERKQRK